jgi:murein DD-endopeptidase MepM/ murein hydrolase activator NlpD
MLATEEYTVIPTTERTNTAIVNTPTITNDASLIPTLTPTFTPTHVSIIATVTATGLLGTDFPSLLYHSQPGDSLLAVASHFGVDVTDISSDVDLPETGLIDPNTLMIIPFVIRIETTPAFKIMPDSEVIFSRSAIDFDVKNYVAAAGGYLSQFKEYLGSTGMTSGVEGVKRIAIENSINPRLLLALLEYESGWVTGQPNNLADNDYPLGYVDLYYVGLFRQFMLASEDLSLGYYGWRSGQLSELTFPDGEKIRIAPDLNAGTVAIFYYFSKHNSYSNWLAIVDPNAGFMKLYENMFGDPWARAQKVEPLFPPGLTQPPLYLPFSPGETWSLSGGPHSAWEKQGALAALDFAPGADQRGCYESESWVLAAASGQVVRSGNGIVILDLDNDGYEQTGWDLLYLHIAAVDRVPKGTLLNIDDRIGHPSCEGGPSTGTHFHFARKFNGEWALADGPLAFNLSGWVAHAGEKPYEGTMTKDGLVVVALPNGSALTKIVRLPGE